MGKAPAFQFYTGDWIQDTRILSLAAKGAWIDLLCSMWRSQTRGTLTLTWQGYARLIGATVDQTKAAITELIDMGICDFKQDCNDDCNANVTLINRRMVKEERERELTRYRVEKHRNANVKRSRNGGSNAEITPPSSSSSSSSTSKPKNIRTSFKIPTLEEVTAYCTERRNQIKPQTWIDHYTSNGWMVGKNKMKDWKAAIRTWESRDSGGNGNGNKAETYSSNSNRSYGRTTEIPDQTSAAIDKIIEESERAKASSPRYSRRDAEGYDVPDSIMQ